MPETGDFILRAGVLIAIIGLGGLCFLGTSLLVARPEMTVLKKILADHHVRN